MLDLCPYFKAMQFSPAFLDLRFQKSAISISQCSTTTFNLIKTIVNVEIS